MESDSPVGMRGKGGGGAGEGGSVSGVQGYVICGMQRKSLAHRGSVGETRARPGPCTSVRRFDGLWRMAGRDTLLVMYLVAGGCVPARRSPRLRFWGRAHRGERRGTWTVLSGDPGSAPRRLIPRSGLPCTPAPFTAPKSAFVFGPLQHNREWPVTPPRLPLAPFVRHDAQETVYAP